MQETKTLSLQKGSSIDVMKGKKPIKVNGHQFIPLTVDEFVNIPEIPTNRNSIDRVKKMRPVFNNAYAANQVDTLTEVAVGIVIETFADPNNGNIYNKGDWYVVDGNTRKHFWKMYPDKAEVITNTSGGVTAKIHLLSSFADVEFAYYPYNNAKSVEKPAEILQGLAKRYNWTPRQTIFANGGYKTALDWACMKAMTLDEASIYEKFHHYFDDLKLLDSIPKDATHTITKPNLKGLKSQAIMASCIIALKNYGMNIKLFDLIERLSTMEMDELRKATDKGQLDPAQIIACEYVGLSTSRSNAGKMSAPWLSDHKGTTFAGSTKFEARQPQMDFILYWISKYVENPKLTYDFNRGIKPTLWEGAWDSFFPDDTEED